MAQKTKSIIEEALLEAKTLEDALKANTKEMLSAHMSKEIENIVESSLREQEEEEDMEGSEDDMEMDVVDLDLEDESEKEMDDVDLDLDAEAEEEGEEEEEVDLDLDTDLDLDAGEDMVDVEMDLELPAMGMDLDDVLDMRDSSDEEVIKVFKLLSDEDEVEVVKDSDGIHLKDNETNAEYYIKESMDKEESMDEEYCSECSESMYEDEDMEGEVMYEIELDDDMMEMVHNMKKEGYGKKKHMEEMKDMEEDYHMKEEEHMEEGMYMEEEEEITEDKMKRHQQRGPYGGGRQRYSGAKVGAKNESRKPRRTLNRRDRKSDRVSENKFLKEYNELKSKNEEYKKALKVFKNKLNEVALFNTNLAYVNRLFTEHSTTKQEKMDILKRFDDAESIKESKTIYKSVKDELERKAPINESVDKKVNKTVKSSQATNLNESTAYVDPQISAIKDLMKRIS